MAERLTLCNFDSLCGEKEAAGGYLAVETEGENASAGVICEKQRGEVLSSVPGF